MENLPQEFLMENSSINQQFLELKTGEITAGAYLITISEILSGIQQIGTGVLLIVNNFILNLMWGNDSIYLILIVNMRMAIYRFLEQQFF